MVELVHGTKATTRAEEAAAALFRGQVAELDEAALLDVFADVPSTTLERARLDGGVLLVDLLAETGLVPSKSRGRTTVEQGGAYVNDRARDRPRAAPRSAATSSSTATWCCAGARATTTSCVSPDRVPAQGRRTLGPMPDSTSEGVSPVRLTGGLPETVLPPEPADIVAELEAAMAGPSEARWDAVAAVARRSPKSLGAWALLGQLADDDVVAYACFRVGYHRGLDALRASGWRGSGFVRFDHPSNRGFLACLDGLRATAACHWRGLRRSGGVRSSSPSSTRHGRSTDSRARPVDACVRWPRVAGGGGCLGPGGLGAVLLVALGSVLWSGLRVARGDWLSRGPGHELAECCLWRTSHRTGVRRQPQRDLRAGPPQHVGRRALGLCAC